MKKMIFVSSGNAVLFILLGLAFLFPVSEYQQTEVVGLSGTLTIFPFLLLAYLILYPSVFFVLRKMLKWNKKDSSELTFSDEREKIVVSEAVKISYRILITGLLFSIPFLGCVRLFSLFTHSEISMYFVSVLLCTLLLIISTIAYCIKWCIEYRK